MKINTQKVSGLGYHQTTNKSLDKYINSKIVIDDSNNNTLNTSYKSINSIKRSPADSNPITIPHHRHNKSINDYINLKLLDEYKKDLYNEPRVANSGSCNYETSAEELNKYDKFKSKMDKVKELLVEIVNETTDKGLVVNELDGIYKNILKVSGGDAFEEGGDNRSMKTVTVCREGDGVYESLKRENISLRRKVEECELKATKYLLENEDLKNRLRDKSKSLETMQKTMFHFQSELNGLTGSKSNGFNRTKSRNLIKAVPVGKGNIKPTKTHIQEDTIYDDYSLAADTIINRDLYYLPKKIIHRGTAIQDIPRLNFVNKLLIYRKTTMTSDSWIPIACPYITLNHTMMKYNTKALEASLIILFRYYIDVLLHILIFVYILLIINNG
jgi:hypothetical protein